MFSNLVSDAVFNKHKAGVNKATLNQLRYLLYVYVSWCEPICKCTYLKYYLIRERYFIHDTTPSVYNVATIMFSNVPLTCIHSAWPGKRDNWAVSMHQAFVHLLSPTGPLTLVRTRLVYHRQDNQTTRGVALATAAPVTTTMDEFMAVSISRENPLLPALILITLVHAYEI